MREYKTTTDLNIARVHWDEWWSLYPHFHTLSASYKAFSMCLDYISANGLDHISKLEEILFIIGIEDGKTIGVLPVFKYLDIDGDSGWSGSGQVLYNSYSYPILPQFLHEFFEHVPHTLTEEDISPFFLNVFDSNAEYFYWSESNVADLRGLSSLGDYLDTLTSKKRSYLKSILDINSDVSVRSSLPYNYEEFLREYSQVWSSSHGFSAYHKLCMDSACVSVSDTPLDISLYLSGELVAVNRSFIDTIRGNVVLIDAICPRRSGYDTRYLGIYSVLMNIDRAIKTKVDFYDLGSSIDHSSIRSYKRKFVNSNIKGPNVCCYKPWIPKPPYYDIESKQWIRN